MKIKFTSLSATKNDFGAFLSIYAAILLKFNGNNTKDLKAEITRWYGEAKPFLDERPDAAKPFTASYNMLTLGKKISAEQVEKLVAATKAPKFLAFLDNAVRVPPTQIKLMKLMNRHLTATTDEKIQKSLDRLSAAVTLLNRPGLNRIFHSDVDSKGNVIKQKAYSPLIPKGLNAKATQLAAIVKQVAGRSNCFLTVPEAIALSESNPKLFAKYKELNKEIKSVADKETKALILASGLDKVPVSDLLKKLQSAGIQNNLPTGFTGSFGVVSNKIVAYTKEGVELDKVPMGPTKMNPAYDPGQNNTYVCSPIGGGPRQEARTLTNKKENASGKYARMYEFAANVEKHRSVWLKDLMSYDPKTLGRPSRDVASAALVEILYQTKHRIGGKGSTKGEETYGISTVTVGHIKLSEDSMTMNYSGKKAAEQVAKVSFTGSPEAEQLGRVIHALVEERKGSKNRVIPAKKKADRLFTYPTKTLDKPILHSSISGNPNTKTGKNTYMGKKGIPITAHGFRHETATTMAKEILATSKFKPGKANQATVDNWVMEKLKPIAKRLAHTREVGGERILYPTTTIKSYIDPQVLHDFYTKLQLRLPKIVPPIED